MQYDQLKDYFESYITNYAPYKDDLIYQQLISFLLEYYFDHSYNSIPAEFRSLYEDQIITFDLYDYILTSNGFPTDIVGEMQLSDKTILISTFMDFNKHKGTIEIIRRVANSFSEKFNIYELFIDYRDNEWVFVPYEIYHSPDLGDVIIDEVFSFDSIIYRTKLFFITKEYLDGLLENDQIVLPIKTNLLFIDYVQLYQETELTKLLATIVFNHYKDYKLILYFEDNNYQISLENAYKLWYYILFKAYPNLEIENLPGSMLLFNISRPNFPFTIDDIEQIKEDYANIHDRKSLTKFQTTYLTSFEELQIDPGVYTSNQLSELYESILDPSLLEYIDFRLAENTIDKPEKLAVNADFLLDMIYNSFITWEYSFDDYNKSFEYIGYFLSLLPLMYLKFETTAPYVLIDYLKPYHTELLIRNQDIVRVKDKFNQLYYDSEKVFRLKFLEYSMLNVSSNFFNIMSTLHFDNSFAVHDISCLIFQIIFSKIQEIRHNCSINICQEDSSLQPISQYSRFMLNMEMQYDNPTIRQDMVPIVNCVPVELITQPKEYYALMAKQEDSSSLYISQYSNHNINVVGYDAIHLVHKVYITYSPP